MESQTSEVSEISEVYRRNFTANPEGERQQHKNRQDQLPISLARPENERRHRHRQTEANLHGPSCPGNRFIRLGGSACHRLNSPSRCVGLRQLPRRTLARSLLQTKGLVTTAERLLISAEWEKPKKLK